MATQKQIDACIEYILENSFVVQETGCWVWQKFTDKGYGYGYGRAEGFVERLAHRLAYGVFEFSQQGGELPEGARLRQKCRNHACCNPKHQDLSLPRPKTCIKPQENGPDETARPPGRNAATAADVYYKASISHGPSGSSDEPGLTWEEVFAAFFTRGK
jgi:hypothetical protein